MYSDLHQLLIQIHKDCFQICNISLGKYLPVAGNIGVFSQNEADYKNFMTVREILIESSDNPNQKYFRLKNELIIPKIDVIPQTTYTHLYIRKPDPSPYGKYLGDIDFVVDGKEYDELKNNVKNIAGAELYDRPGWDTIQITNPNIKSIAYVSTKEFAEKVRIKFN